MIPITPELLAKVREAIARGGNVLVGPPSLCWEIQVEGNPEASSWVQIPIDFFESPHFDEDAIVDMAERHYGEAHAEALRRLLAEDKP